MNSSKTGLLATLALLASVVSPLASAHEIHKLPPLGEARVVSHARILREQALAKIEAAERNRVRAAHKLWGIRNYIDALVRAKNLPAGIIDYAFVMEGAGPDYSRDEAGFERWTHENAENPEVLAFTKQRLGTLAERVAEADPIGSLDFDSRDQIERLLPQLAEMLDVASLPPSPPEPHFSWE